MIFLKDIVIPLIVAALVIGLVSWLINFILKLIGLNIGLIKLVLFLLVWYFVGPIIYNWLLSSVIINTNEILEFIYMPIQVIMNLLRI